MRLKKGLAVLLAATAMIGGCGLTEESAGESSGLEKSVQAV